MIRFLISLFLFFPILIGKSQNLIPNPSAEVIIECPTGLNGLEGFVSNWTNFRGTSDYFNSCADGTQAGWNSSVGFQESRTGNGHLGGITHSQNLNNYREYFGIELSSPLVPGQEYTMHFYSSLGYTFDGPSQFASNNIGVLFMVEEYLASEGIGNCLNFSHYNYDQLQTDTATWTEHNFTFVADSAYRFIAVGNFYDDSLSTTIKLVPNEKSGTSYYFYDDFCLTSGDCETTNIHSHTIVGDFLVYPNPSKGNISISCAEKQFQIILYNLNGSIIEHLTCKNTSCDINLELDQGVYILQLVTEKGNSHKRIIIK